MNSKGLLLLGASSPLAAQTVNGHSVALLTAITVANVSGAPRRRLLVDWMTSWVPARGPYRWDSIGAGQGATPLKNGFCSTLRPHFVGAFLRTKRFPRPTLHGVRIRNVFGTPLERLVTTALPRLIMECGTNDVNTYNTNANSSRLQAR